MAIMKSADPSTISTFAGPVREVEARLGHVTNQHVVAIVLPRGAGRQGDTIARTLEALARYQSERLTQGDRARLKALVDTLAPPVRPPETTLREAKMISEARAEVLRTAEWLTAAELAELAGLSKTNPNAQPSQWKHAGRIFSIKPTGGVDLFPAYGLDPGNRYRPLKALADVIRIFKGRKEAWGLAYWFASGNGSLRGRRPQDLLASSPDRVIAAARDDAQDTAHG